MFLFVEWSDECEAMKKSFKVRNIFFKFLRPPPFPVFAPWLQFHGSFGRNRETSIDHNANLDNFGHKNETFPGFDAEQINEKINSLFHNWCGTESSLKIPLLCIGILFPNELFALIPLFAPKLCADICWDSLNGCCLGLS